MNVSSAVSVAVGLALLVASHAFSAISSRNSLDRGSIMPRLHPLHCEGEESGGPLVAVELSRAEKLVDFLIKDRTEDGDSKAMPEDIEPLKLSPSKKARMSKNNALNENVRKASLGVGSFVALGTLAVLYALEQSGAGLSSQ